MPQYLTLSRAARLVGVRRGALQKKIKHGDLETFEGMIALTDLLQAYPDLQIEDNTILEQVEQIKEAALNKPLPSAVVMPNADILTARVTALSAELAKTRSELNHYLQLFNELKYKLDQDVTVSAIKTWVTEQQQAVRETVLSTQLIAKDTLLRVVAAHVKVVPSGHEFFVEGSDTLLDSALRSGLSVDYGCSDGHCGRCKARVLSGVIQALNSDANYESVDGEILMCRTTPVNDLIIEAPEAADSSDLSEQILTTKISKLELFNANVALLQLQLPVSQRLRFLAGQSATLAIEQLSTTLAQYPIANCPCEDRTLQFHVPADHVRPLFELKTTLNATVRGPHGHFILDKESSRSLVFIAYDMGFAPVKSLIEQALAMDVAESITLYWISGNAVGHYLSNLCRSWQDALDNFHYIQLDIAELEISDNENHTLTERIMLRHSHVNDYDYYIAGPEAVAAELQNELAATGVANARCFIF